MCKENIDMNDDMNVIKIMIMLVENNHNVYVK